MTETFTYTDDLQIEVVNEGTAKFEDQKPQALIDLKSWISDEIKAGNIDGWMPYNNFESSVTWKIKS